jgi:hypothetical protein
MAGQAPWIRKALFAFLRETEHPTDNETLQTLNTAINDAENEGDREFLASVLAPTLSFYLTHLTLVVGRGFFSTRTLSRLF